MVAARRAVLCLRQPAALLPILEETIAPWLPRRRRARECTLRLAEGAK